MTARMRAALALALAAGLALCGVLGGAPPAAARASVHVYESEADFAKQLAGKEVKSVIINKRLRSMRVTLTDGRQVFARYPKKQEPQTASRLQARGVAVTVLSRHDAEKEAGSKKSHHKIRYIVGGVAILLIAIVAAVLLFNRRRRD